MKPIQPECVWDPSHVQETFRVDSSTLPVHGDYEECTLSPDGTKAEVRVGYGTLFPRAANFYSKVHNFTSTRDEILTRTWNAFLWRPLKLSTPNCLGLSFRRGMAAGVQIFLGEEWT